MEFFVLNSAYKPGPTIKNYETLIWTERYFSAGDFKLVVENEVSILGTLPIIVSQLPVGTLVSHTDTQEVMIVENHEINRNADKKLTITISGRSFETFAENRLTPGANLPLKQSPAFVDDEVYTTSVITAPDLVQLILKLALQPSFAAADDAIPNLVVTQVVRVPDSGMAHTIPRTDAYSKSMEYVKLFNGGLRTLRPIGAATNLDVRIHDGLDKQATAVFYALYEDLEDTTYLWSIQGHKNYAQIATEQTQRLYRHRDIASVLTALQRRTMYVEASDIVGPVPIPAANDVVASRAQTALDEHKMISLVQAKISKTAKPRFKIHYDIGDLVKVFTEFATPQTMRVVEHILTVDSKGAIGYPSLSAI